MLERLALVGLTLGIYHGAAGWDVQRAWDDALSLYGRPEVVDWFAAIWRDRLLTPAMGYPTPLPTFLQFLVTRAANAAPGAHVLNVLIHVVNVLLAQALVARWTRRAGLAFAVAAIWAAHPINVESVAWLTDLKRLLAATFLLAGLVGWARYREQGRRRDAALVVLAQALGLASHPLAFTLGPLLVLETWLRSPEKLRDRGALGVLATVLALLLLYVPFGVLPYGTFLEQANDPDVVAAASEQRLPRAALALALQARHWVAPATLHPAYTSFYPGAHVDRWVGAAVFAVLVALTAWAVRRRHPAREGLLLFWFLYLPASGLQVTPRFVADSFLYLPSLGWIAAAATLLPTRKHPRLWAAGTAALVVVLATGAHRQAARWENALSLWEPLIDAAPNYARSYEIVADEHAQRGEWRQAAAIYDRGYRTLRAVSALTQRTAETYRRAGNATKAADVALVLLAEGRAEPETSAFLIDTLVEADLPLPTSEAVRAMIRGAADTSVARGAFDTERRRRIAQYFRAQGAPDIAARFEEAGALPTGR